MLYLKHNSNNIYIILLIILFMAKNPKLTMEQNRLLQGMDLQQKLNQLRSWFKSKQIDQKAFEYYSNKWIDKESKKICGNKPLTRTAKENFVRPKQTYYEAQIQMLIDRLRGNLNNYIANRSADEIQLTAYDYGKFEEYVQKFYSMYPAKIGRLLTVGLRYPDKSKRINDFCCNWISKSIYEIGRDYYTDSHFWGLMWEDGNFVPMDAIRLMLKIENGKYVINPRFEKALIKTLIPYITSQRDKEIERLKWAQTRDDCNEDRQIPRKLRRLSAFNTLLKAAEEYTQSIYW